MTAALFVGLLVVVGTGIIAAAWRYLPRSGFVITAIALPLWLTYVGTLSAAGVIGDAALRPPGIVYVFAPVIIFMIVFAVRSEACAIVASRLPLTLLMGAQVFRVAVEIGIHRLGEDGLVPRLMTYEGGNVDIMIGASAPVMAWLWTSRRMGPRIAVLWNILGLTALVNVALRAMLTAPGPANLIQSEVPNVAMGMFPYTYLAGFFAPTAVLLHILSLRALRQESAFRRAALFNQATAS